jgi:hypothetical protein
MSKNDLIKMKEEMKKAKEEVFQVFQDMRDIRKEIVNSLLGFSRRRGRRGAIISRIKEVLQEKQA